MESSSSTMYKIQLPIQRLQNDQVYRFRWSYRNSCLFNYSRCWVLTSIQIPRNFVRNIKLKWLTEESFAWSGKWVRPHPCPDSAPHLASPGNLPFFPLFNKAFRATLLLPLDWQRSPYCLIGYFIVLVPLPLHAPMDAFLWSSVTDFKVVPFVGKPRKLL